VKIVSSSLTPLGLFLCLVVFNTAVSFNGGGNRSIWRKPSTCRKSLTQFMKKKIKLLYKGEIYYKKNKLNKKQSKNIRISLLKFNNLKKKI
jgi:hypothetical protein